MKTAAVVIDSWKLRIFKKHLDDAGHSYTVHPGMTSDSLILKVTFDEVDKLKPIVEAAVRDCRSLNS